MIQRKQTLWLLLAAACIILSFKLPFFVGSNPTTQANAAAEDFAAGSSFFTLLLTGASAILSIVTIFLFKDRKMQQRLCLAGVITSAIILFLFFSQMQKFEKATPALYCVLSIAALIGYFMAFRGIRSDEKLIKSIDKLR